MIDGLLRTLTAIPSAQRFVGPEAALQTMPVEMTGAAAAAV
jgi:hypothetical protein